MTCSGLVLSRQLNLIRHCPAWQALSPYIQWAAEGASMKTDLTLTVANLDNLSPDVQIQALEELSQAVVVLVEKAVNTLKSSPHPFLVAERLNRFGSLVIEPLETLINSDVSSETKILASLVLLQVGSRVGLPYLW